jgi:para-nitrobenzyl esterase
VLAEYPLSKYGSPSEAVAAAETDSFMACPTRQVSRWLSKYAPVYEYEFAYDKAPMYLPPVSFPYGAVHTVELQFLFPLFHWGPQTASHPLNADEEKLSGSMLGYWSNFAKSGNPNNPVSETASWPDYRSISEKVLSFDFPSSSVDTSFSIRHHCEFWDRVSTY